MKKTDMKMVALVALGVIAAGWLMNAGRDLPLIGDAVNGYDA